jgi:hypothetical protein
VDTVYISGQIGMVGLNEKMSIGRSKSETSEQSRAEQSRITEIEIEKGVISSQQTSEPLSTGEIFDLFWQN